MKRKLILFSLPILVFLMAAVLAAAACDADHAGDTVVKDDAGIQPDVLVTNGFICTTGKLFAGDPTYSPPSMTLELPPSGTGILENPPLFWSSLVFDGKELYTCTGEEVWYVDLNAPSPKEVSIAGKTQHGSPAQFKDGPCADARFGSTSGMGRLSDGSLIVADKNANALVKIMEPTEGSCTVSFYAGTSTTVGFINPLDPPNQGDKDGAGKNAQFRGPMWPIVGPDDVVYFFDVHNTKLKKITDDASHTVSTVGNYNSTVSDEFDITGAILLGDKIYFLGGGGTTGNNGQINEIDVTTGESRMFKEMSTANLGFSPSSQMVFWAIATDGEGLIVTGNGQVVYLSLSGEFSIIAGTGATVEFSTGYDPKAEHPALELELVPGGSSATSGSKVFMAYEGDTLYYASREKNYYVEAITCE